MWLTIKAVYEKNRATIKKAYPFSFVVQRVIGTIMSLLTPLLMYYLVFQKETSNKFFHYTNSPNFLLFVTIGFGAYAISVATLLNVGRALISEIREGTLDTFLISPASRLGYFIGVFVEQLGRTYIEFIIIFLFGFTFGIRLNISGTLLLAISALLISLASFSMSILLSSLMIFTRDTFITQNTLFMVLALVSGISFPTEYLPTFLRYISNVVPLTHALKFTRSLLINGGSFYKNSDSFILTVITSTFFIFAGYLWFRVLEKKLIEGVYG